jgi:hypothetical protein
MSDTGVGDLVEAILARVGEHQYRLVVSHSVPGGTQRPDRYVVGIEFGREAPDSDMAGGAAYGLAPVLTDALRQVAGDLGIEP